MIILRFRGEKKKKNRTIRHINLHFFYYQIRQSFYSENFEPKQCNAVWKYKTDK